MYLFFLKIKNFLKTLWIFDKRTKRVFPFAATGKGNVQNRRKKKIRLYVNWIYRVITNLNFQHVSKIWNNMLRALKFLSSRFRGAFRVVEKDEGGCPSAFETQVISRALLTSNGRNLCSSFFSWNFLFITRDRAFVNDGT